MAERADEWRADALRELLGGEEPKVLVSAYKLDALLAELEAARVVIGGLHQPHELLEALVVAAEDLPLWRLEDSDIPDAEFEAVTRFRAALILARDA